MENPKYKDELEDLLSAAILEAGQKTKRARAAAGSMYVPAWQRTRFTDPQNWHSSGQVQLVHRELQYGLSGIETLVGLFDEYLHNTQPNARKLVAAQRLTVEKPRLEYVTGDHWIGKHLEQKRKVPDRKIQMVEDLFLDMGVSAPAVIVEISLVGGGVARVLLTQATRFESNTPRTILTLPQGMDVLEGLTQATKERIWQEVQRILGHQAHDLVEDEE